MNNYLNNYDNYNKTIIYNFNVGGGGIGDCIKFFMYLLHLCIKYEIKIKYLINNILFIYTKCLIQISLKNHYQ